MEGNQRYKPRKQRAAEERYLRRSFSAQESQRAKGSGLWNRLPVNGEAAQLPAPRLPALRECDNFRYGFKSGPLARAAA